MFRSFLFQSAWLIVVASFMLLLGHDSQAAETAQTPHIVFVMADDMGWGQTGYRNHPVLKTPHLDAMADAGLRFERFYAGCPVCSPTRASVLTGRSPDRAGVRSHGYALRQQEKTIAQALQQKGYVTGHFGKWHLDGYRGPGVPILKDDPYGPGAFGFDEWISVTNFFDQDPLMSRQGKIEQMRGDSSEIVMDQALEFLERNKSKNKPMFAVVWFGTPHSPFKALEGDKGEFEQLDDQSAHHYGELVAMDRAMGTLRKGLREMAIADDTLLVFCSDNGGLPKIKPDTTGGLRGNKGTIYEGGLRVPAIVEWPGKIEPRVTEYPTCTMDLFPTVADLLSMSDDVFIRPLDGVSLVPLFDQELASRAQPIPFRWEENAAWVDNRYKLLTTNRNSGKFQLYDLAKDPYEKHDLSKTEPQVFNRLKSDYLAWDATVDASLAGKDYPEGKLSPADVVPSFWFDAPEYAPYIEEWEGRWEYESYIERARKRQARQGS